MSFRTYESRGYTIKVDNPEQSRYDVTVVSPDGDTIKDFSSTVLIHARIRAEDSIDQHLDEQFAPKLAQCLYCERDLLEAAEPEDVAAAFASYDRGTLADVAERWDFETLEAMRDKFMQTVQNANLKTALRSRVVEPKPDEQTDEGDYEAPALGEQEDLEGFLETLTNDELREWLREHGQPVSGNKAELTARIIDVLTEME